MALECDTTSRENRYARGSLEGYDVWAKGAYPGNAQLGRRDAFLFSNRFQAVDDRHILIKVL